MPYRLNLAKIIIHNTPQTFHGPQNRQYLIKPSRNLIKQRHLHLIKILMYHQLPFPINLFSMIKKIPPHNKILLKILLIHILINPTNQLRLQGLVGGFGGGFGVSLGEGFFEFFVLLGDGEQVLLELGGG